MNRFWNDKTKKLAPYIPGEQPKDKKYIKLNTNENPYGPSDKVLAAIKDEASNGLRLYPDPSAESLKSVIADYYGNGLTKDNVFCGNGSDEVLAMAFDTFFEPGNTVLFPDISYSFYHVYCQLYELNYQMIRLMDDFTVNIEDYCISNGGIVIANPNAPTGIALSLGEIEEILIHNPNQVVIIDEAYIDFGGESAVSLIPKYDNLLVTQTFSKSRSLAGLRLGFALGDAGLIEGINRIKDSFNSYPIDRLAIAGGIASILDEESHKNNVDLIINIRDNIRKSLEGLGFEVLPSCSNFLFIRHNKIIGEKLYKYLRDNGILVRHFNKDRISDFLRVTVGTKEEMQQFIKEVTLYVERGM